METGPRDVRVYVRADGKVPFSDWLESLRDRRAAVRVWARVARLRLGNLGDHRWVGDGVWELRIHVGPGFRVYFGQVGLRLVLLLCGGDKSSQREDIDEAKTCWADYKEGFGGAADQELQ